MEIITAINQLLGEGAGSAAIILAIAGFLIVKITEFFIKKNSPPFSEVQFERILQIWENSIKEQTGQIEILVHSVLKLQGKFDALERKILLCPHDDCTQPDRQTGEYIGAGSTFSVGDQQGEP